MLANINLQNILFLDIETVPQSPSFDGVSEAMKPLWEKKSVELLKRNNSGSDEDSASIYRQAGIFAEFGKVICVSCGYLTPNRKLRIKSFYGDDEKQVLSEFAAMLNKFFSQPGRLLCAHNGKEFDFPFLARRMIVNRVPLPSVLNTAGKKPW